MTLDYKILGQLYYGPEINETPEIPGTSGYYTYTTGSVEDVYLHLYVNKNALRSTDGVNWTEIPISANFANIIYANNNFFATAFGRNTKFTSADGITWTESVIPGSGTSNALLAYGNGKYVLISNNSFNYYALYSEDGVNWSNLNIPSPVFQYSSLIFAQGKFIALSRNSASVSTDGINWNQYSIPSVSENDYGHIVYGNGIFVALSYAAGVTAYSSDGITWSTANLPAGEWDNIAYGNGKFVALAANSNVSIYSTDAINWTTSTLPTTSSWNTVYYAKDRFIGIAAYSGTGAYSLDGVQWESVVFSTNPIYSSSSIQKKARIFASINTLTEVQISIGGQGTPGSYVEITEPQVVYTVPSGIETTITSILVTNHDSVERTFDLAVVPAGETLSLKHHIRWDMPVSATDFDLSNTKITMSAGDKIYVFPSTVNKVGFTLFGVEKS